LSWARLEDAVEEALPRGPCLDLLTLRVDQVPVKLTTAGVDVHLSCPQPALALPEVSDEPESCNDKERKVGLEEVRGSARLDAGV
jgi:hypothetical protein